MNDQDLQREAERYAEYQREQEAYEQAQYDDELSKAHEHIRDLEAQLARVRELPKQLIRALRVAADALEIASDHNVENVQVWPPEAWNLSAINEDSAEGWCSTYALAVRLREVADELESVLQSAAGAGSNQPEVDNPKSEG